jgi:tetratricopeptide (TPR) repeat protein
MPNGKTFSELVALAAAHHGAGRLPDAEASYRAALVLSPGHAAVINNLGVIAAADGRHNDAVALFDEVIAREPGHVAAHYNRGAAFVALGRTGDAIKSFERACVLDPGHYEAHRALGFLWLEVGDRGRSLDHFARTYELRRGDDRRDGQAKFLTFAARSKLAHDTEQFRYLAERRRDRARFDGLARAYEAVAKDFPEQPAELSPQQRELLGDDYNTAIAIADAPELLGGAVAHRADAEELTRQFQSGPSGAVFFDGLLTPRALAALRRYLLESTIWHDFSHIGGFVASYLEDGLACPLVLQIADEIRKAFPGLLAQHPLSQAWAFKGLEGNSTVDVHADDAAITVNFWLTPTVANLTPDRGGLAVCRAPPPRDWEVRGYEADQGRIVAFLEQHGADTLSVPYRENRAVLFDSRLFHASDNPTFVPSYENYRINMTFLFGRHRPRDT